MIKTPDTINRIQADFGSNADEAVKILEEATSKYDYLNHERIIRCIVFLSEKNLENLRHRINQAMYDPRDVMFWAEYVNLGTNETPKRVRDFNKTFDTCENGVTE